LTFIFFPVGVSLIYSVFRTVLVVLGEKSTNLMAGDNTACSNSCFGISTFVPSSAVRNLLTCTILDLDRFFGAANFSSDYRTYGVLLLTFTFYTTTSFSFFSLTFFTYLPLTPASSLRNSILLL